MIKIKDAVDGVIDAMRLRGCLLYTSLAIYQGAKEPQQRKQNLYPRNIRN